MEPRSEAAPKTRRRDHPAHTGAPAWAGDARALEALLSRRIEGEVRFDAGSRALYATDGSNYRQVPIGVVVPRSEADVIETVAACRELGAPILSRGGGTSLSGQCTNVAVVMDWSKYLGGILEVDAGRKLARVQPGCILDHLRARTMPLGLTFGPDPATHTHCTLGGMIGNNSCGIHAVLSEFYGPGPRTEDNVHELDVLTYDGARFTVGRTSEDELQRIIAGGGRRGEIYARLRHLRDRHLEAIRSGFPRIPRRVSGYNLDALLPEHGFDVARALVGSEGTLVTVLNATVKLSPHFDHVALMVLGYPSVYQAADHVMAIRDLKPIGLEGLDDRLIRFMQTKGLHPGDAELLPEGRGWLLVEFGGHSQEEVVDKLREAERKLGRGRKAPNIAVYTEHPQMDRVWQIRESGLGATAFVPGMPDTWPGWEDSAVPPEQVSPYLRDLEKLFDRYGYEPSVYGHFGQGCIHCRIPFDLSSPQGVDEFRRFTDEAADLVLRYGGSLSGEHGDGQARGDLLPKMFGPELMDAFREFKDVWDPDHKMNPGKIVDTPGRTADLRLRQYQPEKPDTHFAFVDDHGDFRHAALRCVGVGKCRRDGGGTMCPSYMVTREEKHTTRGRAHLLFEMLQGGVIEDGWKSEAVKESLELCLGCKGCKGDCPVSVDIGTYKAEFFSHYYEGRLRPRQAYAFGYIFLWARLARLAPGLANFVTHAPGLSRLAKWAANVHPDREIPPFAAHTFKEWHRKHRGRRPRVSEGGLAHERRVVLWADTFNEHFKPETLAAGLEVLEAAGCEVIVPQATLCCGRPLYDFGLLDDAKKLWRRTLDHLAPEIARGTPVVGLEPSCVASFRDELPNLLPDDERAVRLSKQTYTLGEYLTEVHGDFEAPRLARKALVHGHCQHKAVMGLDDDEGVLRDLGLSLTTPDSGCCGMAGPFGYERDKFDISQAAGERVLLPAVREQDDHAFIVADGFSCREQVEQNTRRRPLHTAQVLQYALHADDLGVPRGPAEAQQQALVDPDLRGPARVGPKDLLVAGAAGLVGWGLWRLLRGR